MKICIPELGSPTIQTAIQHFPDIEFTSATDLGDACKQLLDHKVNTILSGLDYSSRDVLLAYRDHLPLKSQYFSSSFICEKDGHHLMIADGGVNKLPTQEQLYTIVEDSATTFAQYYDEQPKIAMLSYSTHGSGGKNPDLAKIHYVIDQCRQVHTDWLIDGEMQLDAAVNPTVAAKKTTDSPLQGQANILITPDLNSGNILYKSLEQFAGWTIAGPLIQGFAMPLADLSRGSSVDDIVLTIRVMQKLCEKIADEPNNFINQER